MITDHDQRALDRETNLAKLPKIAFAYKPGTTELVLIRRGEAGYFHPVTSFKRFADRGPAVLNAEMGVTEAQAEAMLTGSVFGWHVPGADPETWEAIYQAKREDERVKDSPATVGGLA